MSHFEKLKNIVALGTLLTIGAGMTACDSGGGGGQDTTEIEENATLTGIVQDYTSGAPLPGVSVSLWAANGVNMEPVGEAVTQEDGSYQLTGIGLSDRFLLSTGTSVSSPTYEILSNSVDRPDISFSPLIKDASLLTTLDGFETTLFTVDDHELFMLPSGGLQTASGSRYNGDISANVSLIEPLNTASTLPDSSLSYTPSTGKTASIELFGAVSLDFKDSEGGVLDLVTDEPLLLSIPLSGGIDGTRAPDTVTLYYFDEALGYWVPGNEATLVQIVTPDPIVEETENADANDESAETTQTPSTTTYVYQGLISHLSVWAAGTSYTPVTISGCVEDDDNLRIPDLKVTAFGTNYASQQTVYTDVNGSFRVSVKPESKVLITAEKSRGFWYDSLETGDTLEDCLLYNETGSFVTLTWGKEPTDLDAYFYGPREVPTTTLKEEKYIYFGSKEKTVAEIEYSLDLGDSTHYGPEILSMPAFPLPGTYRYVVREYRAAKVNTTGSDADKDVVDSTIQEYPARVELNLNGKIMVFTSENLTLEAEPEADDTSAILNPARVYWHVFNIVVDEEGAISVEPVQLLARSGEAPKVPADSTEETDGGDIGEEAPSGNTDEF